MKHGIRLSIALVLTIVAISTMSSDSLVGAQNQVRFAGDTGLTMLGPNQELRVAAAPGDVDGADFLAFRRIGYNQDSCSGGVCKYVAASQTTSAPAPLMPGEARFASTILDDEAAVRVIVLSNTRNVRVTVSIVDAVTGAIITSYSFGVSQV